MNDAIYLTRICCADRQVMEALRDANPSELSFASTETTPLDRAVSMLCQLKVANAITQDAYKVQANNAMHISAAITVLKDARERFGRADLSGGDDADTSDIDPSSVLAMAVQCMEKVEIKGAGEDDDKSDE